MKATADKSLQLKNGSVNFRKNNSI